MTEKREKTAMLVEFGNPTFTAFAGTRRLASGPLVDVGLAVKAAKNSGEARSVRVFRDLDGQVVDIDLSGDAGAIRRRLSGEVAPRPRGQGRPRLGVVAREVTLMPRHWEWLSQQPGGASLTLRKLVDAASRVEANAADPQRARSAAAHFIDAMAEVLPGHQEASRAMLAGDEAGFSIISATWPADLRDYARAAAGMPATMQYTAYQPIV